MKLSDTTQATVRATVLDVLDPPDDGGSVPMRLSGTKLVAPQKLSAIKPVAPAPAAEPLKLSAVASAAKPAEKGVLDIVPDAGAAIIKAIPAGVDASIKGGAKLVSSMAAPFMKQESLDTLEKKGLYTPRESPVKEYSQAVYSGVMAPLAPLMEKAETKAKQAGVPQKNIDLVETGMDVLGVAGVPAKLPKAIPEAVDAVAGIADAAMQPVRKAFSPASVSPEAIRVSDIKREQIGEASRDTAASAAGLEKHVARFDKLTPQEQVDFPRYMESYSKTGVKPNLPPELKAAADDLRASYKLRADKIQATKSMKNMPLVEDYLARNFKGTPQQQASFSAAVAGKQGKGGFTQARKYPTYEDALKAAQAAGMQPVEPNFVKAANLYNANTDMFIAHNRAIDAMRKEGIWKYARPGKQIPGWEPLTGRMAFKVGVDKKSGQPIQLQAYAPVDAARVYNNYLSKGLSGEAGSAMQTAQRAFNTITMLKLGLSSVWHAGITGTAAISSDMARGTRQLLHGEPGKGAATIAKAPFAPYRVAREGSKFHKQYLRMTDYGPNVEKLVRVATKANTLQSKRPEYMNSAGPQTFKSIIQSSKSMPAGAAKAVAHGMGKAMQAVSAPMFDKWIPNMKRGVIIERLQQWIEEHPNSTEAEQTAYARALGDSVDNRFGEMMRDNLFWNKTLRDAMQFGLLSYSWVAGATRMAGGAAKETYRTVRRSDELGPNAEYLIANAAVAATLNAAYQYMHTGQGPQNSKDMFFPRTGGQQYVGRATVPERAVLPTGHWTQYAEYLHDPLAELYNEGNIGAKVVWEALHNRDYRGMPIAKPTDLWSPDYLKEIPDAAWQYFQYVGGQALTPISIQSYYNRNKGTGIKPAETIGMAARPAPGFVASPESTDRFGHKEDQRLWKAKQKSDARLKGRKENALPGS